MDAVDELFRRHWDGAHRAAYLVVQDNAAAEDIAQEAMLAAIRAIDRFDLRRPFRPWLHRIVMNRSLDWLRARERRPEVGDPAMENRGEWAPASREPGPISDDLVAALGQLDPDQRAAIVLRHLLGYRPREIASMLDVPGGTVRARLSRGLAALRDALTREENDG